MHTGQCLCGEIKFEVHGELASIQICYCKQCQRAQGTVLATNIPVPTEQFKFLSGESFLQGYESSPGKRRFFCSRCGSPIFSKRETVPNVLRIRAGTLDGALATQAVAHFHTGSKPNWWNINDDLPQFEQGRV